MISDVLNDPGAYAVTIDDSGMSTVIFGDGMQGSRPESPTYAGIDWRGGIGTVHFEAFGPLGASLGSLGPFEIPNGTSAQDQFFGVIDSGGIGSLHIWNDTHDIVIDHVRYGRKTVVPEPSSMVSFAVGLVMLCFFTISKAYKMLRHF